MTYEEKAREWWEKIRNDPPEREIEDCFTLTPAEMASFGRLCAEEIVQAIQDGELPISETCYACGGGGFLAGGARCGTCDGSGTFYPNPVFVVEKFASLEGGEKGEGL